MGKKEVGQTSRLKIFLVSRQCAGSVMAKRSQRHAQVSMLAWHNINGPKLTPKVPKIPHEDVAGPKKHHCQAMTRLGRSDGNQLVTVPGIKTGNGCDD